MSRLGQTLALPAQPRSWTPQGWALAFAAMLVLGVVLVNYHPAASTQSVSPTANLNATPADGDDQQLLRHVSRQEPDVRTAYEASLKEVNTYITDAKTPTLIMVGDNDPRVPPPQAQQLYRALLGLGVPTEYVHYPREGHGLREPRHRADQFLRQEAWFERWVK